MPRYKKEPTYLDEFEYMQGLAYRDAIRSDRESWCNYDHDRTGVEFTMDDINKMWDEMAEEEEYERRQEQGHTGYAEDWQEDCSDLFFLGDCDGLCLHCTRITKGK